MPAGSIYTLSKEERICSKKLVEKLFGGGGSHSMVSFPLRAVYMTLPREANEPQAQIMVSVPKRRFKRAVKRNRVKRQVREAYRHSKHIIVDAMAAHADSKIAIVFIWLDDNLHPSDHVARSVNSLLCRITEKL